MDLSKIKEKLMDGQYGSTVAFMADVRLIEENARLFNGDGSPFTLAARELVFRAEERLSKGIRGPRDVFMQSWLEQCEAGVILAEQLGWGPEVEKRGEGESARDARDSPEKGEKVTAQATPATRRGRKS
jgi:hypothetical protein